jgi:histidinol-phosphate/aromatic aminotransferase/cobyric acid decarboxylase-like protein
MACLPATSKYALPCRAIVMQQQRRLNLSNAVSERAGVSVHTSDPMVFRVSNSAVSQTDFGARGGDPSRGVDMDLSTCVNRYGPAPAAVEALRSIEPADIVMHPYDAADRLIDLYRWATNVDNGAMLAGRGASEFIWAMGCELDHGRVHVPLPAYTDYLKAFPGRGFSLNGEQVLSIEQVDAALALGGVVIISNRHNPTGTHLDPDRLIASAVAHPDATLVVDESYVGFTPDPAGQSVMGCDIPHVVVLRSTSKFYGSPHRAPGSLGVLTATG